LHSELVTCSNAYNLPLQNYSIYINDPSTPIH